MATVCRPGIDLEGKGERTRGIWYRNSARRESDFRMQRGKAFYPYVGPAHRNPGSVAEIKNQAFYQFEAALLAVNYFFVIVRFLCLAKQ